MSDFKNVMKNGWHPKGKDGGKESWRGDFKGINQVAGWMGKSKQPGSGEASTHISRPLASLKDPAAFGPPPKNVNYHGGAALPNEITPHRGGLGAPLTKEQIAGARAITAPPEEQKPATPALPYRADRTGLRTDNLPPPPKHHDLQVEAPPTQALQAPRPTPSLPPRLPSRTNTATPPVPPPSYDSATEASPQPQAQTQTSFLNHSAVSRLGNAGVSVPGLGINKPKKPAIPTSTQPTMETKSWTSIKPQLPAAGMSELQSRFSRLNTSTNNPSANSSSTTTALSVAAASSSQPQVDASPPTWKQTRSALTTASSAYKDPTSVTLQDAQSAAQTAQSAQRSASAFRERHNETINAAQTRATQINKRYNMTGRLNKFLEDANTAHDKQEQEAALQAAQHQQQQQQQTAQSQPVSSELSSGLNPAAGGTVHSPPTIPQQPNPWAMQQSKHPTSHQTVPVSSPPQSPPQSTIATPELTASISRKPPPPPPPKKPASMQAPPPVPLGTKPNFN